MELWEISEKIVRADFIINYKRGRFLCIISG